MSIAYYSNHYKDAFDVMQVALRESGDFVETFQFSHANIAFLDHEPSGDYASTVVLKRWELFNARAKQKPVFLYPHTPYAVYLWDDYVKPSPHVACNFVPSEAFKRAMEIYHYPCRVEVVGFTRPLEVKPFRPTEGKHLAISGARLTGVNGMWMWNADLIVRDRALQWVVDNRKHFERVTVYYTFDLEKAFLRPFEGYDLNFICVASNGDEAKGLNTQRALKQLESVDLFIGCNTLGYIALSQGIPTILFGHDNEFPMHATNCGTHYAEYEHICAFPLKLHEMSAVDVLALCKEPNEAIEHWKKINIGDNFNAERFIEIIREYI